VADQDLRIVDVELLSESFKTYRALNNIDSIRYPVLLWLSRPVDPFERLEMERAGILINDDDPMRGLIRETTLEEVRSQMNVLNGALQMAARDGRQARELAEAEDLRLRELATEINVGLRP
jgi:hypothetical protein